MPTYKIKLSVYGTTVVERDTDGLISIIPIDDANADYQQYLIDTDGGLPEPPAEADAPVDSTTTK